MENKNPSIIDTLVKDVQHIIENGREQAYASINQLSIITYWNVGRRIVEEEQCGKARIIYGTQLIKKLADSLTPIYAIVIASVTSIITRSSTCSYLIQNCEHACSQSGFAYSPSFVCEKSRCAFMVLRGIRLRQLCN